MLDGSSCVAAEDSCVVSPAHCAELTNPATPLITVLCGGLGGARLALVLQVAGLDRQCCFITNVADDCEFGGVLVCPDTDAVVYALGGLFDEERGWGIRGDIFPGQEDAAEGWFHVGRRDLELQRVRQRLLAAGLTLTRATACSSRRLGVQARVLPASNDRLRTHVHTSEGVLAWQQWLVRDAAQPRVCAVEYRGLECARATADGLTALRDARLLVIAASSPVASIAPILALPGVKAAIRARRNPTVALSPVVRRRPILCERDWRRAAARAALLAAAGVEHDPIAIARHYGDLVDAYILDDADRADAEAIARLGIQPLIAPTIDLSRGAHLVAGLLTLIPRDAATDVTSPELGITH